MKTLEKGSDKIAKICKALKDETLGPAKAEAQSIVDDAHQKAEEIVMRAREEAAQILADARKKVEQEENVMQSNLQQAGKQALAALRQDIQNKVFIGELDSMINEGSKDAKLIARVIEGIVNAVERDGLKTDLEALVPKICSQQDVNASLGEAVKMKLKSQGVQVGSFKGGAQVKLADQKMIVDISDEALKELLRGYINESLRKHLFGS